MPKTTNEGQSREALTGGYFWFPAPGDGQVGWSVLTCYDLGFDANWSHSDMWSTVIDRLARAWGLEAEPLKRRLTDHHTGLPRGRINHPRPGYILLHGGDSPVEDWLVVVIDRFHLADVAVELVGTEHESLDRRDLTAVQEALGVSLGLDRPVW